MVSHATDIHAVPQGAMSQLLPSFGLLPWSASMVLSKISAASPGNGRGLTGGKGSYQQWRQLTEEAEGPAQSVTLRFSYAPSLPPFAAAPFLTGQVKSSIAF